MITDIGTMVWKEKKELFNIPGSRNKALLTLLAPIIMAILLPWDSGPRWVESHVSFLLACAIPVLLVAILIPNSFAGERERHTLETLLASRLPDWAILFGKVATAVVFSWAVTLFLLLISLVTVNILYGAGTLVFFKPMVALADLALSLLLAMSSAGAGVLISLKSNTTQEATQKLIAILLIPPMLLGPVVLVVGSIRPEWKPKVLLAKADLEQMLLVGLVILAIVTAALLVTAMIHFRRSRLYLD
jgi:ABC-2 type transport system permease protein